MKRIPVRCALLPLVLSLAVAAPAAESKVVAPGDFFPNPRFRVSLSPGDSAYLGLSPAVLAMGDFGAIDLDADLVVLELFNRFCYGCMQQAPLMNQLYEKVQADSKLADRVRFLGVAVGNNQNTVDDYRAEFKVPFPLVPDPKFNVLEAIGNPGGTPYTMLLRRTGTGLLVMRAHFGVMDSPEKILSEVKAVLAEDVETQMIKAGPPITAHWASAELRPRLSPEEIREQVQKSMQRAGFTLVNLTVLDLPTGERIWIGETDKGKIYSRVISRLPVCDVCHPVHFLITFDASGKLVDFDSINVTKYWNVELSEDEVAQLRKKLVGLSILHEHDFNPKVDAVSTATISSSLIFNSVEQTGKLYATLREKGYL